MSKPKKDTVESRADKLLRQQERFANKSLANSTAVELDPKKKEEEEEE